MKLFSSCQRCVSDLNVPAVFHRYRSSLHQLWIEERMPLAMSQEHGHNLQTVQMLLKKNQV